MKRSLLLILLLSVGLNLGLAWRLNEARKSIAPPPDVPSGEWGAGPDVGREAPGPRTAFEDSTRWKEMAKKRLERVARQLDLSPQQIDALEQLQHEAGLRLRDQRQRVETAKLQLHELVSSGQADSESLGRAVRFMANERAAMDSLVTEMLLDELQLMDDGQRQRYLEMLPLEHGPHGRGPGDRPGNRRGPGGRFER